MDIKKVSEKLPFNGFNIYNATSYVQEHTLINRGITTIAGRFTDKYFGTKIMDDKDKKTGFFKRFGLKIKNFRELEQAKNIPPDILKKTKTAGACLYWFSLLTNTALIGFALPKFLNIFLRNNIKKESLKQQYINN